MELFILLSVLIASVATNLMVFQALKAFRPPQMEVLPATLEVREACACSCVLSLPVIEEAPPPVSPSKPTDEPYHAWKNRIEEPTLAPPSPHGPPPKPGPLERPYGFSR